MNTKVIISIIVGVLVIGGIFALQSKTSSSQVVITTPQTVSTTTYILADVAKHTTATSCWTAISGKVYDLTSWISQHPGGEQAILSICGIDGTTAFMQQHGGQGRPEQELAHFNIGVLAQ